MSEPTHTGIDLPREHLMRCTTTPPLADVMRTCHRDILCLPAAGCLDCNIRLQRSVSGQLLSQCSAGVPIRERRRLAHGF
jgi:hypothetical protein